MSELQAAINYALKGPLHKAIQQLEDEIIGTALMLGLHPDKVAKGWKLFEEGQIALHNHAYPRSIHLNRKAIQLLRDFPPPQNNLSLALFFHGMPEEAIRTARQVAEQHPDNIQALSNLVRFLAWTGKPGEASQVWKQLKK